MAKMTVPERREKVLRILRRRNRYQFGQPYATSSNVQRSGCTDTCIQLIVLMAQDRKVSLNLVRARSGAGPTSVNNPNGMSANEALRALHSFGLPYVARTDLTAAKMLYIARKKGPVIMAESYWAHPQWSGYNYAGRSLNGYASNGRRSVRVGFAKPFRRAGLTQWTFTGGHAVLVATDEWEDGKHFGIIRDPNHNSEARPERPAYDKLTLPQMNRMIKSWPYGRLALVPSRVVIK